MAERDSPIAPAPVSGRAFDAADAAKRAVAFLRSRQLPHGEFTTLLGADRSLSRTSFDSSPFITSFVLESLSECEGHDADDIVDRAAGFLASEMEIGGLWRYWSTRQHKHARLPPDVDDTSCISHALKRVGRRVPDNSWILLRSRDDAGRFLTWLPPLKNSLSDPRLLLARCLGCCQAFLRARRVARPDSEDPRFVVMHIRREDIDPVVNANAVLYLGECKQTEAAIQFVIDATLSDEPGFSLYYEDRLALYYVVARAARHSAPKLDILSDHIVSCVRKRVEEQAGLNVLQVAMAVATLLTFEPAADVIGDLVRSILRTQRDDGGWDAFPFYGVWGSEELTTAFCLEVLGRLGRSRTD